MHAAQHHIHQRGSPLVLVGDTLGQNSTACALLDNMNGTIPSSSVCGGSSSAYISSISAGGSTVGQVRVYKRQLYFGTWAA